MKYLRTFVNKQGITIIQASKQASKQSKYLRTLVQGSGNKGFEGRDLFRDFF